MVEFSFAHRLEAWMGWVTTDRLKRWNKLRHDADLPDEDQEQLARTMMKASEQDRYLIKERIAE